MRFAADVGAAGCEAQMKTVHVRGGRELYRTGSRGPRDTPPLPKLPRRLPPTFEISLALPKTWMVSDPDGGRALAFPGRLRQVDLLRFHALGLQGQRNTLVLLKRAIGAEQQAQTPRRWYPGAEPTRLGQPTTTVGRSINHVHGRLHDARRPDRGQRRQRRGGIVSGLSGRKLDRRCLEGDCELLALPSAP